MSILTHKDLTMMDERDDAFDNSPTQSQITSPALINISVFRAFIPKCLEKLKRLLSVKGTQAEVRQDARALRSLMKNIYTIEMENLRIKLRAALKADPVWQNRVRDDLGGEPALRQWEERKRKCDIRSGQDSPKSSQKPDQVTTGARSSSDAVPKSTCKTDRDGLFRLAPITRQRSELGLSSQSRNRDTRVGAGHGHRSEPAAFKPVHLTPQDLRSEPDAPSFELTKDISAILHEWLQLQRDLLHWSDRLHEVEMAVAQPSPGVTIRPLE